MLELRLIVAHLIFTYICANSEKRRRRAGVEAAGTVAFSRKRRQVGPPLRGGHVASKLGHRDPSLPDLWGPQSARSHISSWPSRCILPLPIRDEVSPHPSHPCPSHPEWLQQARNPPIPGSSRETTPGSFLENRDPGASGQSRTSGAATSPLRDLESP